MPRWFHCPYLNAEVELTDEREQYVRSKHSDLLTTGFGVVQGVLADPDMVQPDQQFPRTLIFSRWYDDDVLRRHAVVAVVTDEGTARHWIVTGFTARRVPERDVIWRRG